MAAKHVILSYTDIAAAGSRSCLAVDGVAEVRPVDVPELLPGDHSPAVVDSGGDVKPHLAQLLDCSQEGIFCIVVNCIIQPNVCHHVASRLLDYVVKNKVHQMTVVAALRPDPQHGSGMSDVMESCFNCKPGSKFPPVPEDFQVQDAFLNALLRLLKVEDMPTRFLVARGYRAKKGCPNETDGSLQTITSLQDALSSITGLRFDRDKTAKLCFTGADDEGQAMKNMLYM